MGQISRFLIAFILIDFQFSWKASKAHLQLTGIQHYILSIIELQLTDCLVATQLLLTLPIGFLHHNSQSNSTCFNI